MVSRANTLQVVDARTLKKWLDLKIVTLVDVREPAEYARENIPGAILVSLSSFNSSKIKSNSNNKLVLYCRSGNRSSQAAQKLLAANFKDIMHLEGGITAWKEAGYQTKINKKVPISIMRQVQIVAGSLVFTGTLLGTLVSPWFLLISGFVGAGFVWAGITDTCAMAALLAKLPYNQRV